MSLGSNDRTCNAFVKSNSPDLTSTLLLGSHSNRIHVERMRGPRLRHLR